MANDNQRSSSEQEAAASPGSKSGVGKQGQGGESSRNDQGRSGSAQQEQGGSAAQQGGMSGRDRDEERLDEDIQSGSSPRSRERLPRRGQGRLTTGAPGGAHSLTIRRLRLCGVETLCAVFR